MIEKKCFLQKGVGVTKDEKENAGRDPKPKLAGLGDRTIDPEKEDTALQIVTKSIAISVLNDIPQDINTAESLLAYAKTEFGSKIN